MNTCTKFVATDDSQRGGALVASLLIAATLSMIAGVAFTLTFSQTQEITSQGRELQAFYLAEAGLSEAVSEVAVSVDQNLTLPQTLGTEGQPRTQRGGFYWSDVTDNLDGSYTVRSTGRAGSSERTVVAVVSQVEGGIFEHAIFAGNSSGDPTYQLRLSGVGAEADAITGDIYSGADIVFDDDATLAGDAFASGAVSGVAGYDNVQRPIPDIAKQNYEINNDFDVAAEFTANGALATNALGGFAVEVPEANPAHIFRKNPSDRISEISGTPKDDYFLEDPYMPVTDFTAWNGTQGHTITLAGTMSEPGPSGNDKVYFIDGNLWVHNSPFGRLRILNTDASGARVTFVVKGNVYFSDDVLYADPVKDGVAFIAIKDTNEPDSGNIYLGDPRYGTLDRMQSFLYAENNFYDFNLSASGSKKVELFGNMTAGNKVAIARDFVQPDGTITHSKLTVDFDDRLSTGAITLPGLPQNVNSGVGGMEVVFWREVAN